MVKHCTQCGNILEEGVKFCTTCGHPVSQGPIEQLQAAPREQAPTENQESQTRYFTSSAKKITIRKRVYIPLIIIVLLAVSLYYTGKTLAAPERVVESFKNAVRDHKTHQLASMIHTNENTKVTDAQANAMLMLFNKYPGAYSDVLSALDSSARHSGKMPSDSPALYQLKKDGKKFLIFDNYEITTNAVHPKVVTNLKGMVVGLKGIGKTKTAAKASGESPETVTLNGVIPGYYTLVGKSKAINNSKSVALVSTGQKVNFAGIFIPVDSNIPEAHLFINGKDTGKTIAKTGIIGPFKKADTPWFYATYTINGKSIKSNTITITPDDSDYEDDSVTMDDARNGIGLNFDQVTDGDFFTLDQENADSQQNHDSLDSYFQEYFDTLGSAVSDQYYDDLADYYETGTKFSKAELSGIKSIGDKEITESNQSFDITKIAYTDSDTFSVDITEDWSETYYDDNDNEVDKDFTIKSNFQVKQTAPGELKLIGHKVLSKDE